MNDRAQTRLYLTKLFSLSGLLADRDGDGLPDGIRGLIVLGERAGLAEQVAAVNVAARLGFETLALELPLAVVDADDARSAPEERDPRNDPQRIPIYIGLSGTLSPDCPQPLTRLLEGCASGQGVVAVTTTPKPAVLVGGCDQVGLQAAATALITDGLALGEAINERSADIEAVRISAAPEPGSDPESPSEHHPLRSLGDLFGPEGLAVDDDGDLLPDRSRTRLVLPADLSGREVVAASHLGARIGLETNGISFPLAVAAPEYTALNGEVLAVIHPLNDGRSANDSGMVRLVSEVGRQEIQISGSGSGRAAALDALANLDVWTFGGEPTLAGLERAIDRALALADPEFVLSAVFPAIDEVGTLTASLPPGSLEAVLSLPSLPARAPEKAVACLQDHLNIVAPERSPSLTSRPLSQEVWLDETHRTDWEYEEAWRVIISKVVPALRAVSEGDADWRIDLRISEPIGRREALHAAIGAELRAAGRVVRRDQIRILPTFHQGRAWLLEQILPRLIGAPVREIVVRVRRVNTADGALELPMRWLSDLFPVDELIASSLDLPASSVRFELEDDLPTTYIVEAFDAASNSILRDSLEVCTVVQSYLARFPEWGKVSPPTGCVRLYIGDEMVVDHHLASDPERLWRVLHDTIMPKVEATIRERHGAPTRDLQPFFAELTVEAWLSEDDGAVGVREERNSPLEALHEDVYFGLLDYFTALIVSGEPNPYTPPWLTSANEAIVRRDPRRLTAPGRVVPRIHRRDGMAPELRVHLLAPAPKASFEWRCGDAHGMVPLRPSQGVNAQVVGLEVLVTDAPAGSAVAVVALSGEPGDIAHASALLKGIGVLRTAGAEPGPGLPTDLGLRLCDMETLLFPSRVPEHKVPSSDPNEPSDAESANAPLSLARILRRDEVNRYIERLGRLPGIQSYQIGRSANGRPLLAMEATVPRQGGWWSRAKLGSWKCSLLLNGRHHANEPASTTALLQMAELLASDPEWRPFLNRVNVLFLPGENADGMDLDDTLVAEHPNWMHHAARYNAAGLEFIAAGNDPNTIHTEALAQPTLWRRWSPDIVCDCHGFPSHSWDQPFSGGCNQWFRDNSIPQALIYGIMPTADSALHRAAAQGIGKRLTELLGGDPEIALWNEAHATQYKKYLTTQNPEQFPAPYADGLMIHQSFYDPEAGRPGLAGLPGKHPRLTTASLVTEVADETAQGAYLDVCARSHLLANRALLEYLFASAAPDHLARSTHRTVDGRTHITISRPRPVQPH